MPTSDIAISVSHLSKSYTIAHHAEKANTLAESLLAKARRPFSRTQKETFWALKDINFEIKKGDVVGIVGRNGAGKSTLLKILSRITEPSAGRVDLYGRVGALLEVGTGFHPELTGRENIFLNGAILGMSKVEIRKQFDAIVDFAGVEKFLDTPVKRYSSGMYVRLAFAVAAHLNPEILIVDEVLSVGDAEFQKKCLGKIGEVAKGGQTVLFVSHNLASVVNLCDTAIWLESGGIKGMDSAQATVAKYQADQHAASENVIDLSRRKRDFPSELGRLISLEWLSPLPLHYGQPMALRVRLNAMRDIDSAAVGIGFSFLDGQRFLTFDSDLGTKAPRLFSNPDKAIDLTLSELQISPGVYSIDIGLRSGDGTAFDYVLDACRVDIIGDENTPSAILRYPNVGLRQAGNWEWQE